MLTDEEVMETARWLEPGLRDWISDRLLELGLDPRDGVKVMRAMVEVLREHLDWVDRLP